MMALAVLLATAAVATNVPRLEDCRVVYVHEAGTSVFNGPAGGLCIDEGFCPAHDECRRRYALRSFPFPIRRLRQLADVDARFCSADLEAIGKDGEQWRVGVSAQNQIRLWRVQHGQQVQSTLTNLCISNRCWLPHPRGVARTVLCDKGGVTWVLGTERLYRLENGATTEVALPTPEGLGQAADFFGKHGAGAAWAHQMYQFGDTLWIVRWFTANCSTAGSFVLRVRDSQAEMMAWLPGRFVTGLVRHGDEVIALAEEQRSSSFAPKELIAFRQGHPRDAIIRKIAELDGDWDTREAASRFLAAMPLAEAGILCDALRTTSSPEQKLRLAAALECITATSTNIPAQEIDGFRAGRLVFVDRQGRQYVQPWQDGAAQPRLVVFDGEQTTSVRLPNTTWEMDIQGDDGRLYGHDIEAIHALDPRTMTLQKQALLPRDGSLTNACVVATWRGLFCLGMKSQVGSANPIIARPFWLDLGTKHQKPLLTGTKIAQDVRISVGWEKNYPVAISTAGLWFARQQTRPVPNEGGWTNEVWLTQLNRATNGQATAVSDFLDSGQYPNVWPVGPDTVIVATDDRCFFYDGGQVRSYGALSELVAAQESRLKDLPGDGWMFINDKRDDERLSLLRMGDTFYLEERFQGKWRMARSALRRDGQWIEWREQQLKPDGFTDYNYQPLLNRITAIDASRQRVLTFADDCKVLKWQALASADSSTEELARQSKSWAWYWFNQTQMPRFTKAWTLTPAAATTLASATPNPVGEAEYQSANLPNFRCWEDGRWRETGVSLYGSDTWEDGNGDLWLFRVREAEVLFRDGRRQLIPLDAGFFSCNRLAIESPHAVWVASQQTVTRFELVGTRWQARSVLRLPDYGEGFIGPWIVQNDFYYISHGTLYHTTLATLARLAEPRRIGNWQHAPVSLPNQAASES